MVLKTTSTLIKGKKTRIPLIFSLASSEEGVSLPIIVDNLPQVSEDFVALTLRQGPTIQLCDCW